MRILLLLAALCSASAFSETLGLFANPRCARFLGRFDQVGGQSAQDRAELAGHFDPAERDEFIAREARYRYLYQEAQRAVHQADIINQLSYLMLVQARLFDFGPVSIDVFPLLGTMAGRGATAHAQGREPFVKKYPLLAALTDERVPLTRDRVLRVRRLLFLLGELAVMRAQLSEAFLKNLPMDRKIGQFSAEELLPFLRQAVQRRFRGERQAKLEVNFEASEEVYQRFKKAIDEAEGWRLEASEIARVEKLVLQLLKSPAVPQAVKDELVRERDFREKYRFPYDVISLAAVTELEALYLTPAP